MILSALDQVFMAADRTAARHNRSVFVWPTGQFNSNPLYSEEQLYAAAVVILCKRLGVKPVSVFLVTKEFKNSLPSASYNKGLFWRRPTLQVIAMAADKAGQELKPAELCRSLADQLGTFLAPSDVPSMERHRQQLASGHGAEPKPPNMPALAGPAESLMLSTQLATPLPTALREDFAEVDRLLLLRSIQVACMAISQAAVEQRDTVNLYFQASSVVSYLLKLNGHDLPPYLITHKPRPDATPLDLLRVIAEADRGPDLGAVGTVGDVMVAAAKTIFRHLYLTLPVPFLAKVEGFNAVLFPEPYSKSLTILAKYLLCHKAPYVLSDSSTLTSLYEASDAILWAAFLLFSKQRGNPDEAFVLCTREMSEKIPIAHQYADYSIAAVIHKMFANDFRSVEFAVIDLLTKLLVAEINSGTPQAPGVVAKDSGMIAKDQGIVAKDPDMIAKDQGIIAKDPSIIAKDQGMIAKDQGMIAKDPSMIAKDPDMIAKDPDMIAKDPGMMVQDPGMTAQDPSIIAKDPSIIAKDPSIIAKDPSIMAKDPSIIAKDPRIIAKDPEIMHQGSSITPQTAIVLDQASSEQPTNSTDQVLSKAMTIMEILSPDGSLSIQHLSDIPGVVLQDLPMDLANANRLTATLQLHILDAKLRRDRIPFSDTDHVTVLLDALVALQLSAKGAAAQLVNFPRTRMSDIGAGDRDSLTRLLVAALFNATSMQPAEGSISTAFSELTNLLTSVVEATTSD